jgi:hypothetical protein
VEATEGFDNQGKKHATVFLHLRVILGDLAVGALESSITLCHLRECVVAIKSFSVGHDALVDGREAELVGVSLQGFVEAIVAFDNGGLVGLLARHEVVDRVVRQEEAACTASLRQLAELWRGREAKGEVVKEARSEIVGTGVEK